MKTTGKLSVKKASLLILSGILCLMCLFSGCRSEAEEEKEKISSIEFDVERVEVNVNEDFIVRVKAETAEGKRNESIKYTSINEGFVQIREPNNDGFIVRGLKVGSTVIKVQSQMVVKMLEVKVYGEDVLARYIRLDKPVLEVNEGGTIQTSVSLYGRVTEPDDNVMFQWVPEAGKSNIAINATANIAVIRGIERGYQEIIVKNPRASFDNKILVFVKGVDDPVKYIYRDSNVLVIPHDEQYHDFDVALINGKPEDATGFTYSVVEGSDVVPQANLSTAMGKCNVLAAGSGSAVIRVSHADAEVDFDVRIIVYDIGIPYITLDKSFVMLQVSESDRVLAEVEHARNGQSYRGQFTFEIFENGQKVPSESSIIEVIRTSESFFITGRRAGTARIVVSNEQVKQPREILVVVRTETPYRDDYYISVSQNVITTQVGASWERLFARLVNGVSADTANMEWWVEDTSYLALHTNHGSVKQGMRAMLGENPIFEAFADIEPKASGTTKIRIYNNKWPDAYAEVVVRIYPAGTFVAPPIRVGYDGLIKVEYGNPETVRLRMTSGNEEQIGAINWSVADSSVATLYENSHVMTNILSAAMSVNGGITKMVVDGDNLSFPHESIVLAGDKDYLDRTQVIYVDDVYQTVVEQQTIDVHVLNSRMLPDNKGVDESWRNTEFEIYHNSNPNKVYAVMVKNVLKLMGREQGKADIIVRHPGAANDNNAITLHVTIQPAVLSIDQPYYFTGDDLKGVVRGVPTEFTVAMPQAPEPEKQKLAWSSKVAQYVSVANSSGLSTALTGHVSRQQSVVTVSHKNGKAAPKEILVYVVETAAELDNVFLGAVKENYLLKIGDEQLITLLTNATPAQRELIQWNVKVKDGDPVPIEIDEHSDTAMVFARRAGNAVIEVTYTDPDPEKYTLPLSIYVSVVDGLSDEKLIKGPATIELVNGQSKVVGLEHLNLTQTDIFGDKSANPVKKGIEWEVIVSDGGGPLANVEGNGDSAYFLGLRRGLGKVKITQESLKYEHYATLMVGNPGETLYVVGVENTYQKMLIGEQRKIRLEYGANGFPEQAKQNLTWTASAAGTVKIIGTGKGESVTIVGDKPGETTVTVEDKNNPAVSFNKQLEMKFLVIDPTHVNLEFRGYQKMIGIVVGHSRQTDVHLFDGDEEIKDYELWEHEPVENDIVKINRTDCEPAGQTLDIQAKAVGEQNVVVKYQEGTNVASGKMLVYTALTADDLEGYYPILVEKTNYLLQVGETAYVGIETMEEKDEENFGKVSWGIEGANFIDPVDFSGKKGATIKGKSPGNCVISVNYNDKGQVVNKAQIFVTVVSNETIDTEKYIVTENIIGMNVGEQVRSKIFHNLGTEVSKVIWESLNPAVVTTSGNGGESRLTAVGPGEAYVTVSYGTWLRRHIRVYVRSQGEDVGDYKAMNMETQYYRAGVGEDIVLPVYFAPKKSTVPTLWTDKYGNKVVKFAEKDNGATIEVQTENEGVAVLEAQNMGINDRSHKLQIYIEVSKKYQSAPKPVVERFLTMSKTIYLMNPDNVDEELNLTVQGVGYTTEEMQSVTWDLGNEESGSLVSIYPNGPQCRVRVNPVGNEGTAEIRASKAQNALSVKIVVSRIGMMGFPYITSEDTLTVGLGQTKSFIFDVAETGSYDKRAFAFTTMSGSGTMKAQFNQNVLEVEGIKAGSAMIRVRCDGVVPADHYKDVQIITTTTADGLRYLTTRDNFTQVKIGETKTINIDLMGLLNPAETGYRWWIDEADDKGYIELVGAGRQAQVKGLREGVGHTVKVHVENEEAVELKELVLYVRVVDQDYNTMYLTTEQNILTVIEGQSMYVTAELVNGAPGDDTMISWQSLDPDIAEVMGTGTQAYVIGKHLGFARLHAYYGRAVNPTLEILVIVEKDTASEGIYITSSDSLTRMKPGDERQLGVMLIGGGGLLGDAFGFVWQIKEQVPTVAGKTVIQMNGQNSGTDKVFVKAVSEGEATIWVTHPRTQYTLPIKIYVEENSAVEFEMEMTTVRQGEEKIVRVRMPPNSSVRYSVSKPDIVSLSVSGATTSPFLVITGINPGIVEITVYSTTTPMSDVLIVTVEAVNNRLMQYIKTNETIFNMIDFVSSSNRVMVSGMPVGEKLDGGQFTDADSSGLVWTIPEANPNSASIISFDQGNGTETQAFGKMVSIRSKRVGTAEIYVTHTGMNQDYAKKVYVNVQPYDANFTMSPTFENMMVNNEAHFSINIIGNDIDDSEYAKILWKLNPDKHGNYGVIFPEEDIERALGDSTIQRFGQSGMKTVKVRAAAVGNFNLVVIYGGRQLEATIYVEPEQKFEIYDESLVKVVPGATVFIGLFHEPLVSGGYNVQFDRIPINEFHQRAEAAFFGPIRDENGVLQPSWLPETAKYTGDYGVETVYNVQQDFNTTAQNRIGKNAEQKQTYNALLVVRGTDIEGYTKITLRYKNIERIVTIHNSTEHGFGMTGIVSHQSWSALNSDRTFKYDDPVVYNPAKRVSEIRGKPGDIITINYEIFPEGGEIEHGNALRGTGEEVSVIKEINNGRRYYPKSSSMSGMVIEGNWLVSFTNFSFNDSIPKYLNNKPYSSSDGDFVRGFNFETQQIQIRLNECGYTVLEFTNPLYAERGKNMMIPVYIYYDKMNVDWKMKVATRSRLDAQDNAIYIADDDLIFLDLEKEPRETIASMSVKDYPYDDLDIISVEIAGGDTVTSKTGWDGNDMSSKGSYRDNSGDIIFDYGISWRSFDHDDPVQWDHNIIGLVIKGKKPPVRTNGSESLLKVDYRGVLNVKYNYSNGSDKKLEVTKKFLVYTEEWALNY